MQPVPVELPTVNNLFKNRAPKGGLGKRNIFSPGDRIPSMIKDYAFNENKIDHIIENSNGKSEKEGIALNQSLLRQILNTSNNLDNEKKYYLYNGNHVYKLVSYDRDSEEFIISGVNDSAKGVRHEIEDLKLLVSYGDLTGNAMGGGRRTLRRAKKTLRKKSRKNKNTRRNK